MWRRLRLDASLALLQCTIRQYAADLPQCTNRQCPADLVTGAGDAVTVSDARRVDAERHRVYDLAGLKLIVDRVLFMGD